MRNVIVFINVCILALVTMLATNADREHSSASLTSPQKNATDGAAGSTQTEAKLTAASFNREIARDTRRSLSAREHQAVVDFIMAMNQQRLLDHQQSSLAVQRATMRSLKDYGSWMVVHQQQMLDDLARIARRHGIATSQDLDPARASDLSDIQKLHGGKFDTRYIKATAATLKRDLKLFERATYSPDPDVQVFATRYVSITKDNLAKLQEIRKSSRWRR